MWSYFLRQSKKKHILLCCSKHLGTICMKIPNVEGTRDIKWTWCSNRCAVHEAITAAQVDLMGLHMQSSFNYANTKQTTRVIILTHVSDPTNTWCTRRKTVSVIYAMQELQCATSPTSCFLKQQWWSLLHTNTRKLSRGKSVTNFYDLSVHSSWVQSSDSSIIHNNTWLLSRTLVLVLRINSWRKTWQQETVRCLSILINVLFLP